MEQLLLNIHFSSEKSLENFVIGNNYETISTIKKFLNETNIQFLYLWGVEGSGKSHLSEIVKKNNILVIEDIETKNNIAQIEAFNLFNDCKEKNKKLFITGANSPNNMGLRNDLASRLSWGLVYQIKALTDSEKKLALLNHARQKGMSLNIKVIEYCMRYLKRDLHYLIATLDALDNWSLKTKKLITIPLLKKLLAEKD
ncbi:MAG: DnaA regulatory inactivator Hda [Nitrosomonadales bacterium]|nr:DnaA regulatory inactivator Hda [Nitrosomonadales bacterium]MBT4571678.1 DnaA regulatory inactivator Hda [Nitrosomonadales bacterium]MBT6603273.1 DnaA regulatory inactivator Hda [Nitrosomonadales bacterium]MBT7689914.1 DnaA regulatory inactivator Hda [Nitrosomonadales bacterium]